jgi:hypothetical protein
LPQIKRKLMEEFEKMGKQGAGIEDLLKQLLGEAASNRSSMARMEESMRELKMATDGSRKRIEAMERVEAPPPPPLAGKATVGRSPPTTEKMSDSSVFGNQLHVDTRNRGSGEGILGIAPRPPDMGVSHSAPNFRMDLVFGKYLTATENNQPISVYPTHKHLPKLDFPKFNGENPKIWAKKCEVYFDVLSVPESLHTRYATLDFIDRVALWPKMIEVSGRIEEWHVLCQLVFKCWGKDQHHIFMW